MITVVVDGSKSCAQEGSIKKWVAKHSTILTLANIRIAKIPRIKGGGMIASIPFPRGARLRVCVSVCMCVSCAWVVQHTPTTTTAAHP